MAETLAKLESILQETGWTAGDGVRAHMWHKPGHFLITNHGVNMQVSWLSVPEALASQLTEERLDGRWTFNGHGWTNGLITVGSLLDAGACDYASFRRNAA